MEDKKDKLVIQLYIGRQLHSINIKREQEAIYRNAAREINDKLARYETTYPNLSPDRYMSIALLDFAVQWKLSEQKHDQSAYTEVVERLSQELDDVLKK